MNLGGTTKSPALAPPGVEELVHACKPCLTTDACPAGATCAKAPGSTTAFCATACSSDGDCNEDDVCRPLLASGASGANEPMSACIPTAHPCATAPPLDAGPSEHCGPLESPSVVAACRSCDRDDARCQKNGCFGGWWCNTRTKDCEKPPASCP